MKKARYFTYLSSALLAIWLVWIISTAAAQTARYETLVKPAQDEDMASDCRYELTLPNPTRPIRAVWVIFERGIELTTFYQDPEVIAFARRQRIALMLACHYRVIAAIPYAPGNVEPLGINTVELPSDTTRTCSCNPRGWASF